ncbi:MAG: hypothetical protein AB1938_05000 [Myxococcota bacterium]
MRQNLIAFASAAFLAGMISFSGCGSGTKDCASTCQGCCDADGECQAGTALQACGAAGSRCVACAGNQSCQLGVCTPQGAGGGTGGATGGGSGGGGAGGGAGGGGGGGGGATGGGAGGGAQDAGMGGGGGGGTGDAGCPRTPGDANRTRVVVASHPFPSDGGSKDDQYEVFTLSPTGTLTSTGQFFRMGRASAPDAPIVFTPDGKVGLVPQEDGTLGVFTLDQSGVATVVHAKYAGAFYAGKVLVDASGTLAWITDTNTQANGGGLYTVDIGCDGTLSNERYVLPGDFVAGAEWLSGKTQLIAAARAFTGTPAMQDLHLVDLAGASPAVLASTTGFPDRDAIASTVSASHDDRWVAFADNGFSVGSRIGIFEKVGATLVSRQVLQTPNPLGVAFSPFGTWGLVVNSDTADHYRRLDFSGGAFSVGSTINYVHGRPQLPAAPVMISRGALTGRVLIAELDAVRQLQFEPDGGITDVSKTPAGGTGSGQILGTLGVTP